MAAVVDEGLARLFYHAAHLSALGVQRQHAKHLVAPLVVFKHEGAAVCEPFGSPQVVLVAEERVVGNDGASGLHLEDAGRLLRALVAGFGVFLLVQYGLQLAFGRRLHVVHVALLTDGPYAAGGHIFPVGTPLDAGAVVGAEGAVQREGALVFAVALRDVDVVVLDVGHHRAVGRGHRCAPSLVVFVHPVALELLRALLGLRAPRFGAATGALLLRGGVAVVFQRVRAVVLPFHAAHPTAHLRGGKFLRQLCRPAVVLRCALCLSRECGRQRQRRHDACLHLPSQCLMSFSSSFFVTCTTAPCFCSEKLLRLSGQSLPSK